jgi:hypothetical protein
MRRNLCAIGGAQFRQDVGHVVGDCATRDDERFGNLLIGVPERNQASHLPLTRGQRRKANPIECRSFRDRHKRPSLLRLGPQWALHAQVQNLSVQVN